jgi:mannitol/fructose-specific phosphotransferase system IIA component (Ntr-type)
VIVLVLTPADDPSAQLDIAADLARLFREPSMFERTLRTGSFTEFGRWSAPVETWSA